MKTKQPKRIKVRANEYEQGKGRRRARGGNVTDDVKKALKWLGTLTVPGWNACDHAATLLAHIDAEPARLAAAREEQREADALALLALADPECSCAQEEDVCAACEVDGYARVIRATPLTATPLVRDPGPTEATCKTT